MITESQLHERSGSHCELCSGTSDLQVYHVMPESAENDNEILICGTCASEISKVEKLDANHWRALNTSMWSEVPAVQVMAWRLLTRLKNEGEAWALDLLDTLYLEDETLSWAKRIESEQDDSKEQKIVHKDSNGNVLQTGDTVVLIKDLEVKGGGFTAKRGTAVRGIALVENNAAHIEGRVNGQQIVILTQFVKKS
jgi:protein PhnA